MRAALICASFCLLTGCASRPGNNQKLSLWGFEFAASQSARNYLLLVLFLAVIGLSAILAFRGRQNVRVVHGPSFPDWLAGVAGPDADLRDLMMYSRAVHWTSNDLGQLRASIANDGAINQGEKDRRTRTLEAAYHRWQSETPQGGRLLAQLLDKVFDNGIGIFLSLFALAVFITLAVGLSNSSFFSSLAQVDQARGLITLLVAVCAVAVILLTAINIFWGNTATFEERFKAAKDLVTLVVGVLGTILGFYFGTLSGERLLQLGFDSPASYSVVAAGSTVNVSATARNGSSPYNYDLLVVDAEGKLVSKTADNKQSDNSLIREDVKAPPKEGKYSIILLLRDAKGQQTKGSLDFIVKTAEGAAKDAAAPVAGPPAAVKSETSPAAKPEPGKSADTPPTPNAVK
jgi:hypothetical protein